MMLKDENLLRSLFAAQGLHKQKDIAEAIDMSENSVVRLFQGKPVHRGTARRIARLVGRDVADIFEEPSA